MEGENATTDSAYEPEESLYLTASIVISDPLPTLYWLKEKKGTILNSVIDTDKYEILNQSDTGTVNYFKENLTVGDSGIYVAMATYLDYQEIVKTVHVTFDFGKLRSKTIFISLRTWLISMDVLVWQ